MTIKAKWVRWNGRRGWIVRDRSRSNLWTQEQLPPHLWVVAQIEGKHRGTVQSYDGAGISGGICHHILRYPRTNSYGSLRMLLRDCLYDELLWNRDQDVIDRVLDAMFDFDMVMCSDGEFRGNNSLTPISASKVCTMFEQKESKELVLAVHELFKHPLTIPLQIHHAQQYLDRNKKDSKDSLARRAVLSSRDTHCLWASLVVRASGHGRIALARHAAGYTHVADYFKKVYPKRYKKTLKAIRRLR